MMGLLERIDAYSQNNIFKTRLVGAALCFSIAATILFAYYKPETIERGYVRCEWSGNPWGMAYKGENIKIYKDKITMFGEDPIRDEYAPRYIIIQTKDNPCVIEHISKAQDAMKGLLH